MNVLLLDKNIYYCKTLINAMSALNKEIKIAYVANSIEELTHFYDVDVILADRKDPKNQETAADETQRVLQEKVKNVLGNFKIKKFGE